MISDDPSPYRTLRARSTGRARPFGDVGDVGTTEDNREVRVIDLIATPDTAAPDGWYWLARVELLPPSEKEST